MSDSLRVSWLGRNVTGLERKKRNMSVKSVEQVCATAVEPFATQVYKRRGAGRDCGRLESEKNYITIV